MPTVKPKLPFPEEKCFSMRNFISLLLKNFYFLKYSPIGWFLILFVPISASILFEIAFGQGTFNLKLGVINEEIGLNSCENYNSTCHLASCVYINLLRESQLNLIPYQDTINAYKDARRNLIWGYIYLPHNFTLSLYERIMRQEFVDDRTLADSEVSVWIDMSNQVTGNHLKKSIYLAFNNFLKQLSSSCSLPVHHMRIPIRYNHPIYGSTVPNPNEYSIVGLLLMLEFYLPMTYGAALLDDKLEGVLERGFIAGHTAIEMLVAHIFVTLVLFVISTSLLLTIFYGIFTHAFEGSVILALILLILIGIGGLFYGISVALLFDDYATATTFVLGTILPLTLLSGVIWPTEGMHYYLRSISSILPLTLPTEAYRSIAMRSWTLTHPSVYEGFFSCILWASVFCLATIFIIKNKTGIAVK